jgi:hypothetical protein
MQLVKQQGPLQRLHVMVCTYSQVPTLEVRPSPLGLAHLPCHFTKTGYIRATAG